MSWNHRVVRRLYPNTHRDDSILYEIKDSDIDCFYSNRTVAMVINKLEKEWDELLSN